MARKTPNSKALELGTLKLASSGLPAEAAAKLGFAFLNPEDLPKLHPSFKPLCALQLRYHDHEGKPLADVPKGEPFYRVRYLEQATDFGSMTKKELRYVQPPNTAPVAYYPLNQRWQELVVNPDAPLLLTEGELKAAKACLEGFPCLGLGGVYAWKSSKMGLDWLPSLEPIVWLRRNVYLVFDSDYLENDMVLCALRDLAEQLHRRGAFVHVVSLPTFQAGVKVGLDDFFVQVGAGAATQLQQLLHEAEPLGLTRPLFSFNDRYVYVADPGLIVNQCSFHKSSPASFKDHLEATTVYQELDLKKDGSISRKPVSAAQAWLKWPLRKQVEKLTYEPGGTKFMESPARFNLWDGWGCQPIEGDIAPFMELLDYLFDGAEPEAKAWFLRWCAYPLQHPGTKLFSSVVVHGVRHGTGKSFVGYTLGKIYGANFTEINQADLHGGFNEWAQAKQFVLADDISGSNKRTDADILKKLITQKSLRINAKYVPSYTVADCLNYYFTANHPDSFFLEDTDRRYFIHEVTQSEPLPEHFYVDYELWYDGHGPAHLFHYLLNLDLADFNPAAPAFRTQAKERMIVHVQSDLATWVRDLLAQPDQLLRVGEVKLTQDLFTSKELLELYRPTGAGQLTANGLARELARAGVPQACGGRPIRLKAGGQARYYIIRNREAWLTATATQCAEHLVVKPVETKKY